MDRVHVMLNGTIIDVMGFPDEEFSFYRRCLDAYKRNISVDEYLKLMQENPLTSGNKMVTKEIYRSPLYQAVQDLEYRLRIRHGVMQPSSGDDPYTEPDQPDEFLSANEAGKRKGVSPTGIIKAVEENRLAGHREGKRWRISARSLEKYTPDPVRQSARKK